MSELTGLEREILNLLQQQFPLSMQPYKDMAEKLDISEAELLQKVRSMKDSGLIRRIGAVLDSRNLGFYSTLCACQVPEEKIEQAVDRINREKGVTHNYLRENYYNIWFTLTASSEQFADNILHEIQKDIGIDIFSMPAARVFKIKVSFEMSDTNAL